MNSFKAQRNIWIFAGLCFLLAVILFVTDGKVFSLSNILLSVAAIASLINAYIAHKKITLQ